MLHVYVTCFNMSLSFCINDTHPLLMQRDQQCIKSQRYTCRIDTFEWGAPKQSNIVQDAMCACVYVYIKVEIEPSSTPCFVSTVVSWSMVASDRSRMLLWSARSCVYWYHFQHMHFTLPTTAWYKFDMQSSLKAERKHKRIFFLSLPRITTTSYALSLAIVHSSYAHKHAVTCRQGKEDRYHLPVIVIILLPKGGWRRKNW